jgi:chromosome segregation ATPase
MTNQDHRKGPLEPHPLALRIATRSAFLASRTAKDTAISTLAQQSTEHARLQELHRDLIIQLEQKETQILDLKEAAIKAQSVWTEERLSLQRIAEASDSELSQREAEHACLKLRYKDCVAELERKDAQILSLHSTVQSLSKELDDAANSISERHEAELEQKSSQIAERDCTIAHLRRENSDLREDEAGAQESLAGRQRDLLHATDAATVSFVRHEAEQERLQGLIYGQNTAIEEKSTQILSLQTTIENLTSENSKLNSMATRAQDVTATKEQDLKHATIALSKVTAVKTVTDQRVTVLSANVETLKKETLRCKLQLRDAAQTQAKTEAELRVAIDQVSRTQAISDELKRGNTLMSSEIDNLQARKESLARQLASLGDAHTRMKKKLCNATENISALRTSEAAARDRDAVTASRLSKLQSENLALTRRIQMQPEHILPTTGVSTQTIGMQIPSLPVHTSSVRDDSDLCDWNVAIASGHFDFWADNLHGSEIMPLLSIEPNQTYMIACISELIFDEESYEVARWLTHRDRDRQVEERRLKVVHSLNHFMGCYGCECHRIHIYPDGSQHQDLHVRFTLEALRMCGTAEDVNSMFVTIMSCFPGRSCLEYLKEFGISPDPSERRMLTQLCEDKRRHCRT